MRILFLIWAVLLASTAQSATFNIVATGDSITTGYAPVRLTLAMKAQGISGIGYSIASGGATAPLYVGEELDLNHHPDPAFHNQAHDAINGPVYGFGPPWTYGSVIENNPNPSAVIIMLGTNDAARYASGNTAAWDNYQTKMLSVYEYLALTGVEVYLATPLPILKPEYSAAESFIQDIMIPWLQDSAQDFNFTFINVHADIQNQPNWQSWYGDGIHLYADPAGYTWLADEMLSSILRQHVGDADLDGEVSGLDYTFWADNFERPGNWSKGDFNLDGQVTGADYTLWADSFNRTIFVVPEPSGLRLILAGVGVAISCWGLYGIVHGHIRRIKDKTHIGTYSTFIQHTHRYLNAHRYAHLGRNAHCGRYICWNAKHTSDAHRSLESRHPDTIRR